MRARVCERILLSFYAVPDVAGTGWLGKEGTPETTVASVRKLQRFQNNTSTEANPPHPSGPNLHFTLNLIFITSLTFMAETKTNNF